MPVPSDWRVLFGELAARTPVTFCFILYTLTVIFLSILICPSGVFHLSWSLLGFSYVTLSTPPWPPGLPPKPPMPPMPPMPPPRHKSGSQCQPGSSRRNRYVSSAIVQHWLRAPAAGKICQIATSHAQVSGVHTWLAYVRRAEDAQERQRLTSATGGSYRRLWPISPDKAEQLALSYFVLPDGSREYIEPLSGEARHPLAICDHVERSARLQAAWMGPRLKMETGYIVPRTQCVKPEGGRRFGACTRGGSSRSIFYDLGSAEYQIRVDGKVGSDSLNLDGSSLSGQSVPLFYRMYERRCISFDAIYAWEARKIPLDDWWRPVPAAMRPKIHFVNEPVVGEDTPTANSFLHTLATTAKPADFVVLLIILDYL